MNDPDYSKGMIRATGSRWALIQSSQSESPDFSADAFVSEAMPIDLSVSGFYLDRIDGIIIMKSDQLEFSPARWN